MKKWDFIRLFVVYLFLNTFVHAANVNTLYQTKITVKTQSAAEQLKATRMALSQILVKVTGTEQVLTNPRIKTYLNSAENLLQEFGYTKLPNGEGYNLDLQFDSRNINQLLQNVGEPIWGPNRPLILIWLNYEDVNHYSEVIAHHSDNVTYDLFNKQAALHGLPILFPIMDMIDVNHVSSNDITNMLTENLKNAAARYKSDALLIGKINEDASGLTSQWKLLLGNDSWDWSLSGKTPDDIIHQVMNLVSNTLSAKFASVATHIVPHELTFKVSGINKQSDFEKCMHYIQNLSSVLNAEISQISGNNVIFHISLNDSEDDFIKAIGQGQKLLPMPDNHSQIIYQWNP